MEAAIRWSPHCSEGTGRFLIIDGSRNWLRLCEVEKVDQKHVKYKQLSIRDKLPNFTAFDWSKTEESLVAVGSASGEAVVLSIHPDTSQTEFILKFPIKHQRKCNSIAFSSRNLLAAGLDRVRNDFCMNIYDLNATPSAAQQEPIRKLASSEAINSIKFFNGRPDILVAGVSRQCVRLYDLRDHATVVGQYPTRQVHNLAIDPLDENYFVSAGPSGDPIVNLWDQRFAARYSPRPSESAAQGCVLELKPAVDNSNPATAIWSLRFSGSKRGRFGILSSSGEVRCIDTVSYSIGRSSPSASANVNSKTAGVNPFGGAPWAAPYFSKTINVIQPPWYDRFRGQDENERVISYDFMQMETSGVDQFAIALRPSREVEVLTIPSCPPHIHLTAAGELISYGEDLDVRQPEPKRRTIAEELARIRERSASQQISAVADEHNSRSTSVEHTSETVRPTMESNGRAKPTCTSSVRDFELGIEDTLRVLDRHRRRCFEGYRLNSRMNAKIASDDRALVNLWKQVEHLDELSKDDGMASKALDLSYVGIADVLGDSIHSKQSARWRGSEKPSRSKLITTVKDIINARELPSFQGVSTRLPDLRQLCLAMCGWSFSRDKLRKTCMDLVRNGGCYKSIATAVFQGYKDVALDILKHAVREKLIENVGLGAVIACETVNAEQRELCAWMAEGTEDPYLQALLAHFISADWNKVTEMQRLAVVDRVGVALMYMSDSQIYSFIQEITLETVSSGDIEGIILTGLGEQAMDLFQAYITKSDDLQTAVLAMSTTCPLYVRDARWDLWRDSYFDQLQHWRAFLQRTQFMAFHNRRATTRSGVCLNRPYLQQATVRCKHCQQVLSLHEPVRGKGDKAKVAAAEAGSGGASGGGGGGAGGKIRRSPAAAAGVVCPRCGRHMPRCGICMMWLGSPDPRQKGGAQAMAEEDAMARLWQWCMACGHGCHAHHARDWFAKHAVCPVPDCKCVCGLKR